MAQLSWNRLLRQEKDNTAERFQDNSEYLSAQHRAKPESRDLAPLTLASCFAHHHLSSSRQWVVAVVTFAGHYLGSGDETSISQPAAH